MDLRHHGDREATPGLVDLAVNVHPAPMPPWLRAAVAASVYDLARYPDPSEAERALEAAGLTVRTIAIPGPGRVRSTDPDAGAQVRKGARVTMYVF